jgi:hypothetical protein
MALHQMLLAGYGELIAIVSATTTDLNASTLFGTNYGAGVAKRLIINPGVIVGGTSAGTPALTIPTGLAGSLLIDNYGAIQGAGGVGGTSGAGGDGGNAILAQAACRIINNAGATIYGGGGGGGRGGNGGAGGMGQYGYTEYLGVGNVVSSTQSNCTNSCTTKYGAGAYCQNCTFSGAFVTCQDCRRDATAYTSGGAGGAGGAGGRGQGYEGALAAGAAGAGGAAGGTNAGAGGTGGAGGSGASWGATGVTGNIGGTGANGNYTGGSAGAGGSAGGLAGFYINGLSTFVTLTNSGTVAGRSN